MLKARRWFELSVRRDRKRKTLSKLLAFLFLSRMYTHVHFSFSHIIVHLSNFSLMKMMGVEKFSKRLASLCRLLTQRQRKLSNATSGGELCQQSWEEFSLNFFCHASDCLNIVKVIPLRSISEMEKKKLTRSMCTKTLLVYQQVFFAICIQQANVRDLFEKSAEIFSRKLPPAQLIINYNETFRRSYEVKLFLSDLISWNLTRVSRFRWQPHVFPETSRVVCASRQRYKLISLSHLINLIIRSSSVMKWLGAFQRREIP